MSKIIINNHDEFAQYEGKELGVSEYHQIGQEQINKFADATIDHQWIHIDTERAAEESPFKTTIAHGYLTISLLPYLWHQIIEVNNLKMMINYGIDKFKFGQAVKVDDKVRLNVKLNSILNLRGITKAQLYAKLEIEGEKKPAFDGIFTFLYHFK